MDLSIKFSFKINVLASLALFINVFPFLQPFVQSLSKCPKSGIHNPFKSPERFYFWNFLKVGCVYFSIFFLFWFVHNIITCLCIWLSDISYMARYHRRQRTCYHKKRFVHRELFFTIYIFIPSFYFSKLRNNTQSWRFLQFILGRWLFCEAHSKSISKELYTSSCRSPSYSKILGEFRWRSGAFPYWNE